MKDLTPTEQTSILTQTQEVMMRVPLILQPLFRGFIEVLQSPTRIALEQAALIKTQQRKARGAERTRQYRERKKEQENA